MPTVNSDGSLSFHSSEVCDIVSGKTPYHHCATCNGSGYENSDEDGGDVRPGRSAANDRENCLCEDCHGAGIVPGVALVGRDKLRTFTQGTSKPPVRNIVELPNGEVLDVSQILRVGPLYNDSDFVTRIAYDIGFMNTATVKYFDKFVPRALLISLWKGEICDK